MSFVNRFLEKIFSSEILDKNFLITIVLLILIGLNLLGIDIEYLSRQTYILTTLIITNILITIFLYPITSIKLNSINESIEQLKELGDMAEDFKEDYDLVKSVIYRIDTTVEKISECSSELNESLRGTPNIKALKLILDLRTKGLWNEIFKECLKYLLIYTQESSNVINSNFKNSLNDITKYYTDFVHQNIKFHNIDEELTVELKNKINSNIENIIIEIGKDKKPTEKLYTISLTLQTLEDDINSVVLAYLRNIQSDIITSTTHHLAP